MTGLAVLGGFVLDTLFGDPAWLPHPVVLMGKAISALEKRLRARLPKTPQGELLGGGIVAFCLPVGTFVCTGLVCLGAARLSPWLGLAVQMFWCGQALAAKGLAQESMNVHKELVKGDLPAARKAVSRIVGRDTQNLTAEGVTKAAVETVAENASDGVIAPLLYMLIGGAPLALTYKAINTMDSMLGYKNEKYLYFRPHPRQAGRRGKLSAQPSGGSAVVRGGGPDRQQRQRGVAYLAAGPAQPCQPQQCPDRERVCRSTGRAAGRACLLFWGILPQAYHWRRPASH